jgi:hypothetical protein
MWEGNEIRKGRMEERGWGNCLTWRWGRKERAIGWTNRRDERAVNGNGGKEIKKRIKILFCSSSLMSHALVVTEIIDRNSRRHHEILRSHGYRAQGICAGLSLTHLHVICTQESQYTTLSCFLMEVFFGFSQLLQANARAVPQIRPWPLRCTSSSINYSPVILPFDAIFSCICTCVLVDGTVLLVLVK